MSAIAKAEATRTDSVSAFFCELPLPQQFLEAIYDPKIDAVAVKLLKFSGNDLRY